MKKVTLIAFTIGVIFASCSNNGNEAPVTKAKKVEMVKNDLTSAFKTVKKGSYIDWRVSHLVGIKKRFGKIYIKSVNFLVNDNQLTNATILIDMNSLSVNSFVDDEDSKNKLTGHLKSADFFNVATYPTAKFELTNMVSTKGDFNAKITGNLTILDVTKSITFNANVTISANEIVIKSEDFTVDRTAWGLTYHVKGTEGVPVDYLISNDLGLTINLTVTK